MRRQMKKRVFNIFAALTGFYVLSCGLLYLFQEKLIFHPHQLDKTFQFQFEQNFEEINLRTSDGILIHGLLFKSDSTRGLIFYLHGNAGSLASWGEVAKTYTDLGYDLFMLDYRGYGKSGGEIKNQEQLFEDIQLAYDELMKQYKEDNTIILGYSIGSGLAAKLASNNKPSLLVLQAPYFSLTDIMKHHFSIIPTFILKYKLATNEYLRDCTMPVVVFHGDQDEVIYYGSSLKLKSDFKPQDTLITLHGQRHNGMTDNPDYRIELIKALSKYE